MMRVERSVTFIILHGGIALNSDGGNGRSCNLPITNLHDLPFTPEFLCS